MGSNPGMGQIRKNNTRNRILHIIRTNGRVSKMDIKKISRYSMATVLDTVDTLLGEGLVYYAEKGETKSGRKPTYISIAPNGGYFLGMSYHAREASVALLNYRGDVVDFTIESFDAEKVSVEYVLEHLYALLENMLSAHKELRPKILGIGIGAPGYVDNKAGVITYYSHIENWSDIPLRALVQQRFPDLPVHIENNVNATALAYKWLVPDIGDDTTIIISIRSGVRMSSIINSALYRGTSLTAGEIGHIKVEGGGRYCPCGKKGCLDTEVSDNAIREKILEGIRVGRFAELWQLAGQNAVKVNMDLFIQSVQAGHADSVALLDETCAFLGDALTQIVNMLNPSNIVFNARLCSLGDAFLGRLQKALDEQAIYPALEVLSLQPVAFGEKTAAIGAAAVVMEQELAYVDATI